MVDAERPSGALRPESELRYEVEALCDRVAADLLDRTGSSAGFVEFDALAKKLHERVGDLVLELCRGESSGHPAHPIGLDDTWGGEGRENAVPLSPDPESPRAPGEGRR